MKQKKKKEKKDRLSEDSVSHQLELVLFAKTFLLAREFDVHFSLIKYREVIFVYFC